MIPELAIYLIKKYEGLSLTPYICPAAIETIGYGHAIKKHEKFTSISHEEAERLLMLDCYLSLKSVHKLIKAPLSKNQQASLISFTFNLGAAALERSSLRQKLNREDYLSAAQEFPKWIYAGGRKLPGLIRRRDEEKYLFLAEIDNSP